MVNNMITSEQKFSSRLIQRVSVFIVYTALLGPLVACTDSITGTDDAGATLSAANPISIEKVGIGEEYTSKFSDASNLGPVTTDGFVGEVLDDTIRISWKKDPDATGYNVYRASITPRYSRLNFKMLTSMFRITPTKSQLLRKMETIHATTPSPMA